MPDVDLTDLAFVTVDPPESRDLDQAFHLERLTGGGFRLHYAIADVAAFVTPGGAVDAEAHRRVETAYSPDGRAPLYPPVLSEAAASLLPDGPQPAVVWRVDVDDAGATVDVDVRRAMVASRAKLSYNGVQSMLDEGRADEMLVLLPEVGAALERAERARGGASLGVPTQEVVPDGSTFTLEFRQGLPVEGWNAQLSLLTGRAAADMMLGGHVGIVRTMPPADPVDVSRFAASRPASASTGPATFPTPRCCTRSSRVARPPRLSSCRKPRCCSEPPRTRPSTASDRRI